MPSAEAINAANDAIEFVKNIDPNSLIRRDELGELNFSPIQEDMKAFQRIYQLIRTSSLGMFPNSYIGMILDKKNQAYEIIERIRQFNLSIGNAVQLHGEIINQVKSLIEQTSEQFAQMIGYSYAVANESSSIEQQVQTLKKEMQSEVISAKQFSQEIESILGRARELSAEQGISRESKHFKEFADHHDKKANQWLLSSILMSIFTIICAIVVTFTYKIPALSPKNNFESAQLISGKLIIMSLLVYIVVNFFRNYVSHRHNSIINRHRQNSLLTYHSFVDASPSNESREIILNHAASSVFSPQDTGLLRNNNISPENYISPIFNLKDPK